MVEAGAVRFQNPFTTHELCVAPFLQAVTDIRSLPGLVHEFRTFDGREVAPRVRPERRVLHRVITNPASLMIIGTGEAVARSRGMQGSMIVTLEHANDLLKRLKRKSKTARRLLAYLGGTIDDPYGQHPHHEYVTSKRGDGTWQVDIEKETRGGPLSSCE